MSWTALLGLVFLALSIVTTYLMFQFWGYPYDKEKKLSSCPQWKMNIHRACGLAYAAVYVVMMVEMVPRMWQYQVDLPPRTVAHLLIGITIGVILLVKISILRWFRHFEEWMPALGMGLLLCTFLLTGLSLPFSLAEHRLAGDAYSAENVARVRRLLDGAGLPQGTDLDALATEKGLSSGRRVLLTKCVFCHDLRTVIARPRTPENWVRTVERMVEKPTLGEPIGPDEAQVVAAYLIAITPDLQRSAKAKREQALGIAKTKKAMAEAIEPKPTPAPPVPAGDAGAVDGDAGVASAPPPSPPKMAAVDPAKAKAVYEEVCSQCHELSDVDGAPPETAEETVELMERMVENGMEEDMETLELVRWYLIQTFVNKTK